MSKLDRYEQIQMQQLSYTSQMFLLLSNMIRQIAITWEISDLPEIPPFVFVDPVSQPVPPQLPPLSTRSYTENIQRVYERTERLDERVTSKMERIEHIQMQHLTYNTHSLWLSANAMRQIGVARNFTDFPEFPPFVFVDPSQPSPRSYEFPQPPPPAPAPPAP